MNATFKIFFFIFSIAVLGSCTIQKRVFNNGYHVEWKRKFKQANSLNCDALHEVNNDKTDAKLEQIQLLQTGSDSVELIVNYPDNLKPDQIPEAENENPSDEVLGSGDLKKERVVLKSVQKKKLSPKPYNRGNGGNVLLGLCTLVMICICMAMISYLFSAEATIMGILLIACFGWIIAIFTIILIVLFIVRFVRNF